MPRSSTKARSQTEVSFRVGERVTGYAGSTDRIETGVIDAISTTWRGVTIRSDRGPRLNLYEGRFWRASD